MLQLRIAGSTQEDLAGVYQVRELLRRGRQGPVVQEVAADCSVVEDWAAVEGRGQGEVVAPRVEQGGEWALWMM